MPANLDLDALGQTLQLRRQIEGLSREALAATLGIAESEVLTLESGKDPHATTAIRVVQWLQVDLDDYLLEPEDSDSQSAEHATVAAFLRSDRAMKPESAEAIEAVLQAAYQRFKAA